jgi:hypothetical protein
MKLRPSSWRKWNSQSSTLRGCSYPDSPRGRKKTICNGGTSYVAWVAKHATNENAWVEWMVHEDHCRWRRNVHSLS